jgi:aminomethyltransferase
LTTLSSDVRRGPLFERQRAMGATFYEDYGRLWAPPSVISIASYAAIRTGAMVWDISPLSKFHMVGPQVREALERLTSRPISGEEPGQVRYLVILDEGRTHRGRRHALSDRPDEAWYVGNEDRPALVDHIAAALEGFGRHHDQSHGCGGRYSRSRARTPSTCWTHWSTSTSPHSTTTGVCPTCRWRGVPAMISRTGFSGELGYELFVPDGVDRPWDGLLAAGATPVGLDAVEMARVEVGSWWPTRTTSRSRRPLRGRDWGTSST